MGQHPLGAVLCRGRARAALSPGSVFIRASETPPRARLWGRGVTGLCLPSQSHGALLQLRGSESEPRFGRPARSCSDDGNIADFVASSAEGFLGRRPVAAGGSARKCGGAVLLSRSRCPGLGKGGAVPLRSARRGARCAADLARTPGAGAEGGGAARLEPRGLRRPPARQRCARAHVREASPRAGRCADRTEPGAGPCARRGHVTGRREGGGCRPVVRLRAMRRHDVSTVRTHVVPSWRTHGPREKGSGRPRALRAR